MSTERPNIILITTDQQRGDTIGTLAPAFMRTPHMDVLAREGIFFSRAYADCPICVPSRVTIMNGQHALTHGMTGNGPSTQVLNEATTLPTLLRQAGYQTAAIGKMHFTPERARHGFEEMIIPTDYYRWMSRSGNPLQPMRHGLGQNELYAGMATVPEALTLTNWIADQCVEYIKERRDPTKPFFLWCSFSKPHPPLDPPEPYYSMYRNCDIPRPAVGDWAEDDRCPYPMRAFRQQWSIDKIPWEVIREARAAYYGLVTQIDYNIGRVLAGLQDLDMLREALIVFTSDHGEFLGDHHCGSKVFFHEPSAHIPFIVRLPKSWENRCHGMVCEELVTLADVLPTIVNAAGGEVPEAAEGMDVLAVARGETPGRQYAIGVAHGGVRGALGITDGVWRYMYFPQGGSEQLFNLVDDPRELHDLSAEPSAGAEKGRLKAALVAEVARHGGPFVENGQLVEVPIPDTSEADLRNQPWPGFHTELYNVDVRH
jgi:arylsulfatase